MKNFVVELNKERVLQHTPAYFQRICGYETQDLESDEAIEWVFSHMNPKAIVSEYDFRFFDDEIIIENQCFIGGVFRYFSLEQSEDNQKKILVYLLTIGTIPSKEGIKMLEEYYIDAWSSALVEGAHDILHEELLKQYNESTFITDPFGPGYFGIPVLDTKKIFSVLDYEKIGLRISEGGMMIPEKSCSGFYMVSTIDVCLPQDNCTSCKASTHCQYCRKNRKINENFLKII